MGVLFSQSLYIRKQHLGRGIEIHYCMEIKIGYDLFNTVLSIANITDGGLTKYRS